MPAKDFFSQADGLIVQAGDPIACEVDTGVTVEIGSIVKGNTHVDNSFPKIALAGAGDGLGIGVVIALGEGASGAAGKKVTVLPFGPIVKSKCAAEQINVGERVWSAASGKLGKTGQTPAAGDEKKKLGISLQTNAATLDDEIIWMPTG